MRAVAIPLLASVPVPPYPDTALMFFNIRSAQSQGPIHRTGCWEQVGTAVPVGPQASKAPRVRADELSLLGSLLGLKVQTSLHERLLARPLGALPG